MDEELIPLSLLKEGEEGIVRSVRGGRRLISRLASMGISQNARIRVLQSAGGRFIVEASDARIALGWFEVGHIGVVRSVTSREEPPPASEQRRILVALAGQPNVGKSTIFNILTGLSQHVGNWPGKTVEKKEGVYIADNTEMHIVDLPGTYSLTAFSEEERVARDFILQNRPDVIALLINASSLERSLYLLSELLLLGPPVVAAVNMIDVAESSGISINMAKLRKSLGIPVVPMIATKNTGINDLVAQILATADGNESYQPVLPGVSSDHEDVYHELLNLIREHATPDAYPPEWVSIKLMEGDGEISRRVEDRVPAFVRERINALLIEHEDALRAVVNGRYSWIKTITDQAVSRKRMEEVLLTDRIDHVLTRPIWGIPILLGVFGLIFLLTYTVGFPLQKLLEEAVILLGRSLEPLFVSAPLWLKGLVLDGVIGGAGSVLTFLPILVIFFAVLALLEDVGYMARAAFVMDRFMHLIGLHGKSFMPLCLGFGCNVPAIMGARILESRKARLLTLLLIPFVPCTARLAVLTFMTAALFGHKATLVSWSLLTLNILVLGVVGMAASALFLKDEQTPFIMELPLYHKPNPRTIGMVVWSRSLAFVKKAGTVIVLVSVVIWLLSYLPEGRLEDSFLARGGMLLEPFGVPLGLDWKMVTALLTSIVAKENAVATLGVLYGVGDEGLVRLLPSVISAASGLSFLVVLMLFVPCAATVAVMKQEMRDRKWFVLSLTLTLVISYLGGMAAYRIAFWLGL
ncbi:ferrous iron transport protein B [Syntrophus buswellii]|uniref:ferrous iron transport protein B n=1 Tax=Syntrophus TaxID=43773 RepID=UPI0009D1BC07|nr:MAG: Ferrous iron transport protein B [Syntrophus sp. PtaB.Bin138]